MRRTFKQEQRFDVVVVGGGLIGLACAWRSAQRGLSVCVLERGVAGGGASGVAAGMLSPIVEAAFGDEELLRLNLASAVLYPAFVAELEEASGCSIDRREAGCLCVALDRDECEDLRREHAFRSSLGLEVEWLLPRACRRLEPALAPSCAGGMHAPTEAAVDPRTLLQALERAVERAGGTIVNGAEVTRALFHDAAVVGVETADGRHCPAENVVVAAGCWSGSARWLPSEFRPPVRPVKGQILVLEGSVDEPLLQRCVRTPSVYLVPRQDGRLVIGATVEERGFDTTVTAGGVLELLREAYRALPAIAELELIEARAGLRPGTPDNLPLIGRGAAEGLWLATGHYRHGVLLAPVTAAAVAALLVGDEPPVPLDAFSPDRFAREVVLG